MEGEGEAVPMLTSPPRPLLVRPRATVCTRARLLGLPPAIGRAALFRTVPFRCVQLSGIGSSFNLHNHLSRAWIVAGVGPGGMDRISLWPRPGPLSATPPQLSTTPMSPTGAALDAPSPVTDSVQGSTAIKMTFKLGGAPNESKGVSPKGTAIPKAKVRQ